MTMESLISVIVAFVMIEGFALVILGEKIEKLEKDVKENRKEVLMRIRQIEERR